MTNQRGLKEIGRRSNWIWNRTVKELRWLQEPEIGLRNAQLIIQLVQICQNFSCSFKKRAAAREGKVGKSWHKPNINWPSGSFGCTLSTFFCQFRSTTKNRGGPKSPALGVTNLPWLCALSWIFCWCGNQKQGGVSACLWLQRAGYWKEEPGRERCTHDPRSLLR